MENPAFAYGSNNTNYYSSADTPPLLLLNLLHCHHSRSNLFFNKIRSINNVLDIASVVVRKCKKATICRLVKSMVLCTIVSVVYCCKMEILSNFCKSISLAMKKSRSHCDAVIVTHRPKMNY